MKKIRYSLYLVLIVLIAAILTHRTTLRFVDSNGASIRTDQIVRVIKIPLFLHVEGYRLSALHYKRHEHLLSARYQVRQAPLSKVKKAKYLLATFQPTTVPIENGTQRDPFILSRQYGDGQQSGRDTLRILVGNQYGKFKVLSANYPAVNVRDPSIMKQGRTYYIIYTRGLLATTNFNHWRQLRWPAVPEFEYAQDWAPEFVQGPNGKNYIVMSVQKKGQSHHQLMVTSFTNGKIGKHWVPITGNLPTNTIDPNIQYLKGHYYLFCKNETTRKLVMGISSTLTGPYQMEKIRFDSSKYGSIEGPEALIKNGVIKLAFDTYDTKNDGEVIFHGLHYIERKVNGGKWSSMRRIQSPIVTRHGQIIVNK